MLFAVGAGILVLLVVGYALVRSQSTSNEENRLRALADTRSALLSLEGSPGVTTNITTVSSLQITCEEGTSTTFSFDDEMRAPEQGLFIAAPSTPLGEVLTVTSVPVGSAYRIGTLLYVRPANTNILLGDNLFPAPFPVASGPDNTLTLELPNANVVQMSVLPSALEQRVGTVMFGQGSSAQSRVYIGSELLLAAAVSGNASQYDCVMDRYGKLLAFETELQHRRVLALRNEFNDRGSTCASIYDERAFNAIEQILYDNLNAPTQLRSLGTDPLRLDEAEAIASAFNEIEALNAQLLRGDRCATIS
jgi:hypothetical protein